MDIFLVSDTGVALTGSAPDDIPAQGFLWLDATHDEVAADPEAWHVAIERHTGIHLYELHL